MIRGSTSTSMTAAAGSSATRRHATTSSSRTPPTTGARTPPPIEARRRWLKRNPQTRYDLIVQNPTYHWRANAGNLLSREYLTEVRKHLNPGGVVTTNTTGSFDLLGTGPPG